MSSFRIGFRKQRNLADRSLRKWIAPTTAVFQTVGYEMSPEDCKDFMDWIFAESLLQVPLFFARLVEARQADSRIAPTVLAKEAEGLASTIEHIINAIGAKATGPALVSWPGGSTLWPKLKWLWDDVDAVKQNLDGYAYLTQTTKVQFVDQQRAIVKILGGCVHQAVVQHLLLATLVRDQAAHRSLVGVDEVDGLIEILLRTLLLVWKQGRKRGLV